MNEIREMSEQNFRTIHQVGSYPAETEEQAMHEMMDRVGPHLRTLPDGETGKRQGYIMHVIEGLRKTRAFELEQDGDWSSVENRPILRVRKDYPLHAADIVLPYAMYAHKNWDLFEQVARDYNRTDDLLYQVSIPSPTTMEFIAIGPAGGPELKTFLKAKTIRSARDMLRHYDAFADATAREITNITNWLPGRRIVCQIEATAELILAAKAPEPLRSAVTNVMGRRIARLAMAAPENTRFGLHFCLGSLDNKAEAAMHTLAPAAKLARATLEAWPSELPPPEYVHTPIATSDGPAPQDEAFYHPLQALRLPEKTRFYAGVVQEAQSLDEQQHALRLVEENLGRRAGIAAACGLGRRAIDAARAALDRSVELATT